MKERRSLSTSLESNTAVQMVDRLRWWRLQRVKEQPLLSECYILNNNYYNYSAFRTRPLSIEVQRWLKEQERLEEKRRRRGGRCELECQEEKYRSIELKPAEREGVLERHNLLSVIEKKGKQGKEEKTKHAICSNIKNYHEEKEKIEQEEQKEQEYEEQLLEQEQELEKKQEPESQKANRAHSEPLHNNRKQNECHSNNVNYNHYRSYHSEEPILVRFSSDNEFVADNKMPETEIDKLIYVLTQSTRDAKNEKYLNNSDNDSKHNYKETANKEISRINTNDNDRGNKLKNIEAEMLKTERLSLLRNTARLFRTRASSEPTRLPRRKTQFMREHSCYYNNNNNNNHSIEELEYNDYMEHSESMPFRMNNLTSSVMTTTVTSEIAERYASRNTSMQKESESFFETSRPHRRAVVLHHPPRLVMYSKHFPLRRLTRAAAIKREDVAGNELMKHGAAAMSVGNLPLYSYERTFYDRQLFNLEVTKEHVNANNITVHVMDSNKFTMVGECNTEKLREDINPLSTDVQQHNAVKANSNSSNNTISGSNNTVNRNSKYQINNSNKNENNNNAEIVNEQHKESERANNSDLEVMGLESDISVPASPVAREGRMCILTTSAKTSANVRTRHLRACSLPALPLLFAATHEHRKGKRTRKNMLATHKTLNNKYTNEEKKEGNSYDDEYNKDTLRNKTIGNKVKLSSSSLHKKLYNQYHTHVFELTQKQKQKQLCRYVEELQDAYVFNPFVDCIGTGAFSQVYAALPIFESKQVCCPSNVNQKLINVYDNCESKGNDKNKRKELPEAVAIKVIARKAKHKDDRVYNDVTVYTPKEKQTIHSENKNKNNGSNNNTSTVHEEISDSSQRRELMEIEREIGILRRLRYSGCSVFYEALRTREEFVIVMKLHHGSINLRQFLDMFGIPSENRVALILFQLLTTVHYLHHTFGVIHRDIKLENLLISAIDIAPRTITQCLGHNTHKTIYTHVNVPNETYYSMTSPERLFDDYKSNSNTITTEKIEKEISEKEEEQEEEQKEERNTELLQRESKGLTFANKDQHKEDSEYHQRHNRNRCQEEKQEECKEEEEEEWEEHKKRPCGVTSSYNTLAPTVPHTPHSLLRLTLIDFGLARRTHLHKANSVLSKEQQLNSDRIRDKCMNNNTKCNDHEYVITMEENKNTLHLSNSYNGEEHVHKSNQIESSALTTPLTALLVPTTLSTFTSNQKEPEEEEQQQQQQEQQREKLLPTSNAKTKRRNSFINCTSKFYNYRNVHKNLKYDHFTNNTTFIRRRLLCPSTLGHYEQQQQQQQEHMVQDAKRQNKGTLHDSKKLRNTNNKTNNNNDKSNNNNNNNKQNKSKSREQSFTRRALPTPLPSTINLFTAYYDVEDEEETTNSSSSSSSNSSINSSICNNSDNNNSSSSRNTVANNDNNTKFENYNESNTTIPFFERGMLVNMEKHEYNKLSEDKEYKNKSALQEELTTQYSFDKESVKFRKSVESDTASISARSSEVESVHINSDNESTSISYSSSSSSSEDEEKVENNNSNISEGDYKHLEHDMVKTEERASVNSNALLDKKETNDLNDKHNNNMMLPKKVIETELSCNSNLHLFKSSLQSTQHNQVSKVNTPSPPSHRSVSFSLQERDEHHMICELPIAAYNNDTHMKTTTITPASNNLDFLHENTSLTKTCSSPVLTSTPEVAEIENKANTERNARCYASTYKLTNNNNNNDSNDSSNDSNNDAYNYEREKHEVNAVPASPTSASQKEFGSACRKMLSEATNPKNTLMTKWTLQECSQNEHEKSKFAKQLRSTSKFKNYCVRTLKRCEAQQQSEFLFSATPQPPTQEKQPSKDTSNECTTCKESCMECICNHSNPTPHKQICTKYAENENAAKSASLLQPSLSNSIHKDSNITDLSTVLLLTPCGTEKYLAPEMLEWIIRNGWTRKPTILADAQKLDLYAIGIVAYVLLSGCFPFNATTQGTQLQQQRRVPRCNTANWSNVSRKAIQFVQGLLEPNPSLRFSTAQALSHPFMQEARRYAQELEIVPHEEVETMPLREQREEEEKSKMSIMTTTTTTAKGKHHSSESPATNKNATSTTVTVNNIITTNTTINNNNNIVNKTINANSNIDSNIDNDYTNNVQCSEQTNKPIHETVSNIYLSTSPSNKEEMNSIKSVCYRNVEAADNCNNVNLSLTLSTQLHISDHKLQQPESIQQCNVDDSTKISTREDMMTTVVTQQSELEVTNVEGNNARGAQKTFDSKSATLEKVNLHTDKVMKDKNNNDKSTLSIVPCEYDGSFLVTAQSPSTQVTNINSNNHDINNKDDESDINKNHVLSSSTTQVLWSADHDDLFEQLYDNILYFDK